MTMMDILQEIPDDDLPALRKLCIEGLPTAVHVYNFLSNAMEWRIKYPDAITVYAPNGDWKPDGTFVTILKWVGRIDLFIFTLEKSCDRLYNALSQTKVILWQGKILIAAVHTPLCPTVHTIIEEKNLNLHAKNVCGVWTISKEKAVELNTDCPDDVYIKRLSVLHAEKINDVWPHKFPNSEVYTRQILEKTVGYGIFLKSNDELVSWAIMSHFGAIGIVQTIDEHKRKGYAALITNYHAKKFAAIGLDSFGTVLVKNTTSQNMFIKLGFEVHEHVVFFEIEDAP